jgi:hypothetical protein
MTSLRPQAGAFSSPEARGPPGVAGRRKTRASEPPEPLGRVNSRARLLSVSLRLILPLGVASKQLRAEGSWIYGSCCSGRAPMRTGRACRGQLQWEPADGFRASLSGREGAPLT